LKRNITEVLRRGLDTTIANWPVILLRITESVLFAGIVIAAILAAVIPAVVAAGLSKDDIVNSADPGGAVLEWVTGHIMLFVWIFALGFIVLGVMIAIHSFIEGASTQIYVDAERAAKRRSSPTSPSPESENPTGAVSRPDRPAQPRDDFRAFTFDRWLSGGASSWWRIFWVYNLAWSVSLIAVVVPLIITMIAMLAVSDTVARVIIGCAGVGLAVLILIPVGIATSIWCKKAITICVARAMSANESLRLGWREFRADLGRHLAIAVIVFVLSMALNSLVSAFSVPMNITQHKVPDLTLMFAPVRIATGVLQGMIGAAVSSFFLACFVSMTEER
jgi:hypothetical protein